MVSWFKDVRKIIGMFLGLWLAVLFSRIWYWDARWHLWEAFYSHALLYAWAPFFWKIIRRHPYGWIDEHILRNDWVEGLSRSMRFVTNVIWILLTYQFTTLKSNDPLTRETETAQLRARCADQCLQLIMNMKGYYIKVGQTLCGAGLFPKEFNEAFGVLLDQCPREPFSVVRRIIECELQCDIFEAFQDFDEEAVAAASIGQVHFGKLHDGTRVAVKIQYPEVERFFYGCENRWLYCRAFWHGFKSQRRLQKAEREYGAGI